MWVACFAHAQPPSLWAPACWASGSASSWHQPPVCRLALLQFAVQYDHRAAPPMDRMEIINLFAQKIQVRGGAAGLRGSTVPAGYRTQLAAAASVVPAKRLLRARDWRQAAA